MCVCVFICKCIGVRSLPHHTRPHLGSYCCHHSQPSIHNSVTIVGTNSHYRNNSDTDWSMIIYQCPLTHVSASLTFFFLFPSGHTLDGPAQPISVCDVQCMVDVVCVCVCVLDVYRESYLTVWIFLHLDWLHHGCYWFSGSPWSGCVHRYSSCTYDSC